MTRPRDRNGRFIRGYVAARPDAPILVIGEDRITSYTLVRSVLPPRRIPTAWSGNGWTEGMIPLTLKFSAACVAAIEIARFLRWL